MKIVSDEEMKKRKALVNVIIITYNAEKFIDNLFKSVFKQDYSNYFITVVDNNSKDETINLLKKYSLDKKVSLKIIKNNDNTGFAKANNLALRKFKSDYSILLNQDSIVEKDFITQLVKVMDNNQNIAVCGGAEHPYNRILKSDRKVEKTNWVGCGATILNYNLIEKIDFFDENYFIYHEDIDLCWRAIFAGHEIYYTPHAIWHHYGWGREVKLNDSRVLNSFMTKIYLLVKFGSFKQILRSLKIYKKGTKTESVKKDTKEKVKFKDMQKKNRLRFILIIKLFFLLIPKIFISLWHRQKIRRLSHFNQKQADKLIMAKERLFYAK